MIIAIDPGNEQSAFVYFDGKAILNKGILPNNEVRKIIKDESSYPDPPFTVIEMVASYGMPVGKTVFETCVWIGRFVECSHDCDLIYRKDVKMHLCQSMRAKDSNVRQALIDRFGKPGTIKNPNIIYGETSRVEDKIKADMWAALAVAVTWWDQAPNRG